MFALPFFRRDQPVLKGEKVALRVPLPGDHREWSTLRGESRAFLERWEPRWTPDELERSAWRHRIGRYREDYAQGTAVALFIFERSSGKLAGGITLGNIRHGVAQSGHIGYWIGERYAGKGLMTDAVKVLAGFAFDTLKLHRIEAACIPDNIRSIRVLEKAGFQREGLLRSYLRINGAWQDHYLYARIADDPPASATKG
ncbi:MULTISPECIES: GNAT family N-acetyltransferase [Phyllobacteriaceae]|uniref:GNAT family N-acetyltransferase n=1 Tax=Mesorhizobium hungaricum TaxID=1566387 RepID=A0A1C2DJM9_9HYPH|nr:MULTISPECIES: GNAT family protein [Mesorhizobium]MBN9233266.1 GNAT family N-acetyltransferase [Mesorhizobium sp.]MDQ0332045.1 ribosomal-protein-alanine N-acetyltransferase [Mesorhizobium sp. YL-MeA3-2017]OCX14865.1 GNAT family N-acetyltransferase [Mesorhizobium hungaricum]